MQQFRFISFPLPRHTNCFKAVQVNTLKFWKGALKLDVISLRNRLNRSRLHVKVLVIGYIYFKNPISVGLYTINLQSIQFAVPVEDWDLVTRSQPKIALRSLNASFAWTFVFMPTQNTFQHQSNDTSTNFSFCIPWLRTLLWHCSTVNIYITITPPCRSALMSTQSTLRLATQNSKILEMIAHCSSLDTGQIASLRNLTISAARCQLTWCRWFHAEVTFQRVLCFNFVRQQRLELVADLKYEHFLWS